MKSGLFGHYIYLVISLQIMNLIKEITHDWLIYKESYCLSKYLLIYKIAYMLCGISDIIQISILTY